MKVQAKYKFAFKGVIRSVGDVFEVTKEEYEIVKTDVAIAKATKKTVPKASNKQVKNSKKK